MDTVETGSIQHFCCRWVVHDLLYGASQIVCIIAVIIILK